MTPESPTELEPFHFTSSIEDGWLTVVHLQGDFDSQAVGESGLLLRETIESGTRWLLIDMLEVDYLDGCAFSMLIGVVKQTEDRGGCLSVACDNPLLLKLLARSDTKKLFNTRSSIEEARSLLEAKRNASEVQQSETQVSHEGNEPGSLV